MRLDCLRKIETNHGTKEGKEQRNLRLKAEWDTDCAFEANQNWKKNLVKLFSINTLVDSNGEPQREPMWDDPNQADMCEIVRTLISRGVLRGKDNNVVSLDQLHTNPDVFDNIECAKYTDAAPGICAVAGSSYFLKTNWSIFFGGDTIKVFDGTKSKPAWRLKPSVLGATEIVKNDRISEIEEKAKLDAQKELAEITGAAAAQEEAKKAAEKKAKAGDAAKKGAEGVEIELPEEPETPKLCSHLSNALSESAMNGQTKTDAELMRSIVHTEIERADAESWKLALYLTNVSYQMDNPDRGNRFELTAFEKDQTQMNGSFTTRSNQMFGTVFNIGWKRIYKGPTHLSLKQKNQGKETISAVKVQSNLFLIDDAALPGKIMDVKRLVGPTNNVPIILPRVPVYDGCRSIFTDNNPTMCSHKKGSYKYLMRTDSKTGGISMYKMEIPTAHLSKSRLALFTQTISFTEKENRCNGHCRFQAMLALFKGAPDKEDQEEGAKPKSSKEPMELPESLCSDLGGKSRQLTGFGVIPVTSKLHKIGVRIFSSNKYELNVLDPEKAEVSVSSILLPPGSDSQIVTKQSFLIQQGPQTFHTVKTAHMQEETSDKEVLLVYNIVFPIEEQHRAKPKEVNRDGFKPPFQSWIEADGVALPGSVAKAGQRQDNHVSCQIIVPFTFKAKTLHKIEFKYKSSFIDTFNKFTGDKMLAAGQIQFPAKESELK